MRKPQSGSSHRVSRQHERSSRAPVDGGRMTPLGEDAAVHEAATETLARLIDDYRQAAVSMQGLPMYNPALAVEGVGFREHLGRQVGVVVTPWFMNLTVLPAPADSAMWRNGGTATIAFPSGLYDFVVSETRGMGPIATCSLFSPMHDFGDHETARATALAAVDALFEPPAPPKPAEPKPTPQLSRRRFLGG
jgi:[NiFe] hydrogenase assembly HybE family chaperone